MWASSFGHGTLATTGWAQAWIEEASAGVLRRAGNVNATDQRYAGGHPAHYSPLYMRTPDLSWAGTTRTISLKIEAEACNVRMVAQADSPITMRVVRAY